jgi:hypothetical protein
MAADQQRVAAMVQEFLARGPTPPSETENRNLEKMLREYLMAEAVRQFPDDNGEDVVAFAHMVLNSTADGDPSIAAVKQAIAVAATAWLVSECVQMLELLQRRGGRRSGRNRFPSH